jgi:1-acyl-sn-glycerol-3-phosphate acyltransferase
VPASLQFIKLAIEWGARKVYETVKGIAKLIYTIYMVTLMLLAIPPMYFISLLTSFNTTARCAKGVSKFILAAGFSPLRIFGAEHFSNDKPVIYAANHASYMDAVIALAFLPAGTRFVAKKELFSLPIIGRFMQKMGYLSVDRMNLSKGLEDTVEIESALRAGNSVLIFPEGTFGYAAGLRPFRLGAFKIASEAAVAVIPVAIKGARKILRDGSWLMQPNRVKVTICEPIYPTGKDWQDITRLRQTVRAKIAQYCGETSLDLIAAQTVAPSKPKS